MTIPHLGVGLVLEMLSALIPSRSSYSAMPVFRQQTHQGSVPLGPLVLERAPLKNQTLAQDRDRQFVIRDDFYHRERHISMNTLHVAMQFGLYLVTTFVGL